MEAAAPHVRLFTAGLPAADAPKWYYQDLEGQLQGPFDANTMSRWCGENALPRDLKCLGVHSADSAPLVPSSAALSHFQPLEKLLENAAAGIQYMPVRLGKGSNSDEGPATPQSAAPPKGSRLPGGPGGANNAQASAGAGLLSNGGPDVTRAVDQRASLAAAAAAAAAAAGGMNGFQAQQQALQGAGLMNHLQQMQQRAQAAGQARPQQAMPQQGATQPPGPPNTFLQQQQLAAPQQRMSPGLGAFIPPLQPPAGGQDGAVGGEEAGELTPNDAAWEPALLKLLKREGFSGKEADVKWRVIVASGDRVGPFSTDQMVDWLLGGKPPKGINKQQAQQTAQNPPALAVAGILSSDYNAQRLPGAKFFKPLGVLLALITAGMQYQAVNKHDLQRGLPNKGWNEGVGGPAGAAKPAGATPPLPTGKGASKAAKAAARNSPAGPSNSKQSPQMPGSRSNSQLPGPRSRSSTPGGLPDVSEGPAAPTTAKSSSFKHPMALRQQQQRQQEALLAAAGQALPGQPGVPNPAGSQLGKGLTPPGSRGANMPQPNSASRSILTAANSMGPAGLQAAGLAQQQQLAAAQQAAASRLAQGMPGAQQQFLTPQQQMQAATMAFMQAQPGAMQAVWLKQQQQMPGQVLAGVYPAGQTLVGYAGGMPGLPMAHGAAAGGQQQQGPDGGLPRSSSTGSSAQQQQQQQPPPPNTSVGMMPQQQMLQAVDGQQAWQLQQQAAAAAAAGKIRPPGGGVPAFALGGPGGIPGQPGVSPSHQLMHAAALLFLHDQQQQPHQQPKLDKPQKQWWVQRNELAFSGPFTGLQMYQAYLQPQGPLRLTEGTPIASVAGSGPVPQQATRDVPPMRAFAPLSCLLEAAAQGFVLVPWPAATPGVRDNGPSTLLVQQAQSGVTVPLQNVLSQPGLMALQQQQQQPGSTISDQQQGGEGGNEPDSARMGQTGMMQVLAAAKQRQQAQQGPQMLSGVRPAAGGYIQLPNGQLVPAGAQLVPVPGGGLAMLQANPAGVPQPPVVDPLAVANALFTAGGNPHTIVWYIRTDAQAAGGEGQQGGSIQGPYDPQDMLGMYRENRLDPSTMLCATHRAAPGQQQMPPPPETFKPLHALMHTVSTPGNDMHGQQAAASVPGTPAAGAGGMMQQQMVPAGMILAQAPGSVGPVLFQVPVSSGGAGPAVLAMPAGALQMQQMGPMSGVPHMAGPGGPYLQTPQGMMAQQHMMAVLAAQQQAQQQQQQQAQQHAQQQAAAGMQGEQGARQGGVDNGPASTGGSSSSAPTPQQLAAAGSSGGAQQQQQQAGAPAGADVAQRAGAVPPRVDTWGSLAAAQELLQRRPSASSSNGQQTPAAAASAHSMEAALAAAAAASSRRASVEGHHPQGGSGGMMMLSGGQHMQHHMQQQAHHMQGGPRSAGGSHHHPASFMAGPGSHPGAPGGPHSQPGSGGVSGPRSTSSIGRHPQDSAAAAAAAASALAGGLNLQGAGSPSFGGMPQAQQQQLYMQAAMLASMAPQSAAMLQQQQMQLQMQQQQQAAALAAVSAAQAAPGPAPGPAQAQGQLPPAPASAAVQPAQEPQTAAGSEAPADA